MESEKPKVIFLGDAGVGKTSIINAQKEDPIDARPTITTDHFLLTINDRIFDIYDTAGQERFRSISDIYFKVAWIAVIVFDLNDIKSFNGLEYFIEKLLETNSNNPKVILVGNKNDLDSVIDKAKIDEFKAKYNISDYFSTSAISKSGINDLFNCIYECADSIQIPSTEGVVHVRQSGEPNGEGKSNCC